MSTRCTFTNVRAAFESWCDLMGHDRRRGVHGDYIDPTTRARWAAWCAAKGFAS